MCYSKLARTLKRVPMGDTTKLNALYNYVWLYCTREVYTMQDHTRGNILTLVFCWFKKESIETTIRTKMQTFLGNAKIPFHLVVIPSDENQPKVDTDVDGFVLVFGGSNEDIRDHCAKRVRFYCSLKKPNTVLMTRAGVPSDVVSCTPVDHYEQVVLETTEGSVTIHFTEGALLCGPSNTNTIDDILKATLLAASTFGNKADIIRNVTDKYFVYGTYTFTAHLDVPFNVGFDHLDVPFNVGFAFRALQAGVRDMLSPMFDVSHSLVSSLLAPHTTTL